MNALQPLVYPVIHHLDAPTTFSEIQVARTCGADGVFLISHDGADLELVDVARTAIRENAGFPIGLNLLSMGCVQAAMMALEAGSDMLWADDMGVDSQGLTAAGQEMATIACDHPRLQLFASVAFKYRPHEPNPVGAAAHARAAGFIPTTSGDATGHAGGGVGVVAERHGTPHATRVIVRVQHGIACRPQRVQHIATAADARGIARIDNMRQFIAIETGVVGEITAWISGRLKA